jgi:hypothetical protein
MAFKCNFTTDQPGIGRRVSGGGRATETRDRVIPATSSQLLLSGSRINA